MRGYSFSELVKLAEGALKRNGDTATGNLTAPKFLLSAPQAAEPNSVVRKDFFDSTVTGLNAENSTMKLNIWEAMHRSYAEAGYNLVDGSFEAGGVLTSATDVLIYGTEGKAYSRNTGPFPYTVQPRTTPSTPTYTDRSGALLRLLLEAGGSSIADIAGFPTLLGSTAGASTVNTTEGVSVQSALDSFAVKAVNTVLSRVKYRLQEKVAPWGQAGPVNILGDSMSFGYFASWEGNAAGKGGMFYNRWVSILARMLSVEFSNNHYITCNPNLYEYAGDEDVVRRTFMSPSFVLKNTGLYTSNLYVGQASCTSTLGDYFEFEVPATFKEMWVHYVKQPGGGTLGISQNGGTETTYSCEDTVFKTGVARVTVVSNPQGYSVVKLRHAGGGEIGISAVSPTPGVRENGTQLGGGLNVFAAGGRRLQDVSEQVIHDSCSGAAALILALGFNDNPLNGAGPGAGRTAFTQRIDWVIQYCLQYQTPLIVPDFSWKNTADQFTRRELRRAAEAVGGLYIPLPDMLRSAGIVSDAERIASGMWRDGAHPAKRGHAWIAETIAKVMGLAVTSKQAAISQYDYWLPMKLTSTYANILVNLPRNIAAYKLTPTHLELRGQIKLASGAAWPSGVAQAVCGTATGSLWWLTPPVKLGSFYTTKLFGANENTGEVLGYSSINGAGVNSGVLHLVRPDAATPNVAFNGASSHEITGWGAYDNI